MISHNYLILKLTPLLTIIFTTQTVQVNLEKWSPSPSSTVKLNVDASVNGGGSGVLGGIMRDANGEVVGTAYLFMERAWGVEEMEAGAVRWESKIASEMRIDKLMVETDCQQVAWALKHKKTQEPKLED